MSKKFLSIICSLIIFGGILTGCGETEVQDVTDAADPPAEPKQEENEETVEDKVYKIGETVSVNGMEITINSAKFTEPGEYTEATNGKVITLEVTAKNSNDEQAFIDNTEFAVYDSEGNKMEDYYGYDEMAISDNINAGKQLQGKLYFDVKEQQSHEMIYTPSFSLDSKEVKFEITPE